MRHWTTCVPWGSLRLMLILIPIDIGINQSDETEKTRQVQKIFTLFSKASSVVVWLGAAYKDTTAAVDYLSLPGEERSAMKQATFYSSPDSMERMQMYEICQGLIDLCCRPWIRRVWVQQEVIAPQNMCRYTAGLLECQFLFTKPVRLRCTNSARLSPRRLHSHRRSCTQLQC